MTIQSVQTPPQSEQPLNLAKPATAKVIPLNTVKLDIAASRVAGYAIPQKEKSVAFVLIETNFVFAVQVGDRSILIGRCDFESNERLDIDLMTHGGREKGVSRCHAALFQSGHKLSLVDLNSTNGTYLNGVPLLTNQPHHVQDGDEICLGKMLFHIHFAY